MNEPDLRVSPECPLMGQDVGLRLDPNGGFPYVDIR